MSSAALASGSKVLVTGASGFLGIHVVDSLLKAGMKVIGTVRSDSKGEYIKKQFEGKPFSYVIVEDIGAEGAFDEAVKNVDAVAHTASPFHMKAEDPEELIRPAVDGTIGVIKSIKKNNKDIKRVVVTSSVAAILSGKDAPYTYTEDDVNERSIKECKEKGKDASPADMYMASKSLAEKAAWKECEGSLELVTINPCIVYGPILHECDSADKLNTSVAKFYGLYNGQVKESDLPGGGTDYVDVRDVADAHVLALTKAEAANNRFITSARPYCMQEVADILREHAPELKDRIPKGQPERVDEVNDPKTMAVASGKKVTEKLGLQYRTLKETTVDMYESLKARGF